MSPEALADALSKRPFAVLTGAGCSTESGIPDYRGQGAPRPLREPMRWQSFRDDPLARQRYWARAFVAWPSFNSAAPNRAHLALARLQTRGKISVLVTQNVDALHERAGSPELIKLHGDLAQVRCLACGARQARAEVHERLQQLNPDFASDTLPLRPDGDVELAVELARTFRVADCQRCGGALKPDVVFFGENVPRSVKDEARERVGSAGDLLVVGSSLAVGSARTVVRQAERLWILNLGPTRFDTQAQGRAEAKAGPFLDAFCGILLS